MAYSGLECSFDSSSFSSIITRSSHRRGSRMIFLEDRGNRSGNSSMVLVAVIVVRVAVIVGQFETLLLRSLN